MTLYFVELSDRQVNRTILKRFQMQMLQRFSFACQNKIRACFFAICENEGLLDAIFA